MLVLFVRPMAGVVSTFEMKMMQHQQNYISKQTIGRICLPHRGWEWKGGDSYIYKPNFNFLEMAHTNLFASIRTTAYQPLI